MLCYFSPFVPKHILPHFLNLCLISENADMVIISFFQNLPLQFLCKLYQSDYRFINYAFSSAFPLQRTICFFSTVAWLRMMVAWINRFLVVWFDNISHILCATVAYIHIIPIENFMKPCSNAKNADLSVEGASLQRL